MTVIPNSYRKIVMHGVHDLLDWLAAGYLMHESIYLNGIESIPKIPLWIHEGARPAVG